MASEISVERQFRFHCSCGAITVSGEKKVICTGCGDTLGVRRIRRHRQHRDSVTYYGGSTPVRRIESRRGAGISGRSIDPRWTIPVQRIERRIQDPNVRARVPGSGIIARVGALLKSALAYCGNLLKSIQIGKHLPQTRTVLKVEAQESRRDTVREPRGAPLRNPPGRFLVEGMRVKVGQKRPDGKPHPHAGQTGRITRFINSYSEPHWLGPPTAMIRLDSAIWTREFIWVSLECLEALPEDSPSETRD
jgi:hypothetical protein